MGDGKWIDVPHSCQVLNMGVVLPVPETWQIPVTTGLSGVLGRRLAVHLQYAASGLADHAAHQVDVVYLARPRRRAVPGLLLQLPETHRVGLYVLVIDPVVLDDLVHERVQQRQIRPVLDGEVDVGLLGHRGRPGVYGDEFGRVLPPATVEDAHPGDRLGLGHVVAVHDDRVGVVYVGVGARLPVAAEALLERLSRRRRAQSGVAVEVVGADTRPRYRPERVVLLEE